MKKVFFLALLGLCNYVLSQNTALQPHFIPESKKVILPEGGPEVCPEIHDGMIAIRYNGSQLVYINEKGDYVFNTDFPISRLWSSATDNFYSGAATVLHRTDDFDCPCILYPDGKYLDLKNYISVSDFCDGYALAVRGRSIYGHATQVYLNTRGQEVFRKLATPYDPFKSPKAISPLRQNRRAYFDGKKKKYGYLNSKWEVAIPPRFTDAKPFSGGVAAVQITEGREAKWGFINLHGEMVIAASSVNAPEEKQSVTPVPEDGLVYCVARFRNDPRFKKDVVNLPCFINSRGEIILYFE